MEYTNLGHHHHQHHEQLLGSSSIPSPSSHGVGTNQAWHQNLLLNSGNYNPSAHGVLPSSRTIRQSHEVQVPPLNTSMIQQLGFQLGSSAESYTNHLAHEPHLAKLEELRGYFPEFSGTISDTNNLKGFHLPSKTYIKHEQQELQDLNEKHLLNTFSSGCQMNGFQLTDGELYSNVQNSASFGGAATFSRGNLGQFLPRVNIQTTPSVSSSSISNSLDMNLQALDLLASAKFGGSFGQASLNNLDLFREGATFGLDHVQEQSLSPSNSPQNISSFMNGVAGTKRFSNGLESRASQVAPKKLRSESPRSSFSPFKVRKEKLGDRIAALQQLVAPFGKTDTASVLMEAIGYIKFLQDQVETLSVPYMKSSESRELQGGTSEESEKGAKQDLRSRGLCLVPLSCTSYVANFSGGVWSPPNFSGGGT